MQLQTLSINVPMSQRRAKFWIGWKDVDRRRATPEAQATSDRPVHRHWRVRTVTVAGASLLQRVAARGRQSRRQRGVVASGIARRRRRRPGFVGVIASCELDQPALQKLLYDLEAGMPFLFIDQLVVQAPLASSNDQEGRMRILLAVSGQWQGGK